MTSNKETIREKIERMKDKHKNAEFLAEIQIYNDFIMAPRYIHESPYFTDGQKMVMNQLISFILMSSEENPELDFEAVAAQKTIARRTTKSEQIVKDELKYLKWKGIVKSFKRGNGSSNRYEFVYLPILKTLHKFRNEMIAEEEKETNKEKQDLKGLYIEKFDTIIGKCVDLEMLETTLRAFYKEYKENPFVTTPKIKELASIKKDDLKKMMKKKDAEEREEKAKKKKQKVETIVIAPITEAKENANKTLDNFFTQLTEKTNEGLETEEAGAKILAEMEGKQKAATPGKSDSEQEQQEKTQNLPISFNQNITEESKSQETNSESSVQELTEYDIDMEKPYDEYTEEEIRVLEKSIRWLTKDRAKEIRKHQSQQRIAN